MNRLIYFDNLRSLSIILTLAALLLPLGTVFYEGSTTIAIAVIFFISAYFGASKLRIRTITFFLKDRWHRLGLPLIVLVLFGIEEKIVTGTLPIVSWALAWLLLLFALLSLVKRGAHSFLQQRKLAPPSIPFLTLFFLLLAAALYGCRLFLPQSLIIPFIAVIRPDWLILSTFSFIMGLQAFRSRWFTANGYQPSLGIFIAAPGKSLDDSLIVRSPSHNGHFGTDSLLSSVFQWPSPVVAYPSSTGLRLVLHQRTDYPSYGLVSPSPGGCLVVENLIDHPHPGRLQLSPLPIRTAPPIML